MAHYLFDHCLFPLPSMTGQFQKGRASAGSVLSPQHLEQPQAPAGNQ